MRLAGKGKTSVGRTAASNVLTLPPDAEATCELRSLPSSVFEYIDQRAGVSDK